MQQKNSQHKLRICAMFVEELSEDKKRHKCVSEQ